MEVEVNMNRIRIVHVFEKVGQPSAPMGDDHDQCCNPISRQFDKFSKTRITCNQLLNSKQLWQLQFLYRLVVSVSVECTQNGLKIPTATQVLMIFYIWFSTLDVQELFVVVLGEKMACTVLKTNYAYLKSIRIKSFVYFCQLQLYCRRQRFWLLNSSITRT